MKQTKKHAPLVALTFAICALLSVNFVQGGPEIFAQGALTASVPTASGTIPPLETPIPAATVTISNRIDGTSNIQLGQQVNLTIQIANEGRSVIATLPLTYTYPSTILRYESATLAPDDSISDGQLNWHNLHLQGLAPGKNAQVMLTFTTIGGTSQLPGGQATITAESLGGQRAAAYVGIFQPSSVVLTARTVQIDNHVAKLQWATADEKNVLGYHVWQQIGGNQRTRLTQAQIPANLSGQTGSASYRREYSFSGANEPIGYFLEIALLSGTAEFNELGTIFQAPDPEPTPTPFFRPTPTKASQPTGPSQNTFLPLITK